MSEEMEKLIKNVQKYSYIFDSSHEDYKNILLKAEAWNKIAEELNIPIDTAKTRWKNLRDSYMRFKRAWKGEKGHARKYAKWPWSRHMSFLDATLQYRPRRRKITRTPTEIRSESLSSEPTLPAESNILNLPLEKPTPPQPKKKVKCTENISSDSEFDEVINLQSKGKSEEKTIDGVDHLFLSYAATFKTFRPKTQAIMKLKLATLFSETELKELEEHDALPTTSPAFSTSTSAAGAFQARVYTSCNFSEGTSDDNFPSTETNLLPFIKNE